MLLRHPREVLHRPERARPTPSPATRGSGLGPPLVIGIGSMLLGVRAHAVVAVGRPPRVLPAPARGRRRRPSSRPAPRPDRRADMATQVRGLRRNRRRARRARRGGRRWRRSWATRSWSSSPIRSAGSAARSTTTRRPCASAAARCSRRRAASPARPGVELELVLREHSLGRGADRGGRRARRADDRGRLLRRAPAQERARRVDADAAAAPLRAPGPRRSRARVTPARGAAPCAPRRGSATLLARMTFSLALRLLLLPPRGE